MASATFSTRREKEKFLLRPLQWASSVVFFSFVFGLVFWLEGEIDAYIVAGGLIIAMGTASALLFLGIKRVIDAARGRM